MQRLRLLWAESKPFYSCITETVGGLQGRQMIYYSFLSLQRCSLVQPLWSPLNSQAKFNEKRGRAKNK